MMEGFTGIGHIAIRARDLDPMLDFYTGTLGFAEMFRLHQDNGDLMLVYVRVTDTQYLEFFPNGTGDGPAPREAVGLNHLCLTVDDLDTVVAQLTARGVPLTRPLVTGKDGNRQAWIEDPEGNRLELMEMSPTSKQAEALARLKSEN
jgi:lactoylglutathione lyase